MNTIWLMNSKILELNTIKIMDMTKFSIDTKSSKLTWNSLKNIMLNMKLVKKLSLLDPMNSLIYTMMISKKCIMDSNGTKNKKTLNIWWEENQTLTLLIGVLKELSPPLKTKDHVDHVGLSVPLDHLKELTSLKMENYYLSLNKN